MFGFDETEFNELMKGYSSELPSLLAQAETDAAFAEAEARAAKAAGINLTPIFAAIESFMYRLTRLEQQNLEFERRIAELESERSAMKENK